MDDTASSEGTKPPSGSTPLASAAADAFHNVGGSCCLNQQDLNAARARIAGLSDKQMLGLAGVAFPASYPMHLVATVREQLAVVIAQHGEPMALREQAAARAAGQAVMLHVAGAREVVAEALTCDIGLRIGWAGAAGMAIREQRLIGFPNQRPYLNVVAFGACLQVAAIRAVGQLAVVDEAGIVGNTVLAQYACTDLGERLRRDPADMWGRAFALVDWVFDASRGLLPGLYTAMQGVAVLSPITINHFAQATRAKRLDRRDSIAEWFTDPMIVGVE